MSNTKSAFAAALAAMLIAACGATPTRESTGEYIDDAAITTKVKATLVEDKTAKASDVMVETFKGTVQLSGFANSRAEIDAAVQAARQVKGVKEVRNDIQLKPGAQ
ncbi:MAG TPA: BON domain-containing protein [Rhodocyclaceae bacterium]|nr:BON domain-containing protein [Rhodocyclaceae bacterium]